MPSLGFVESLIRRLRGRFLAGRAGGPVDPVVFRWDLDKTYLKSDFESLRDLVRIPFERAEDKVAAPGVAALMRALRSHAESSGRPVRVTFLSASPPQIGAAIRKKLELDRIVYDEIVFKDQLQRILRGKFRHLREQVGYKLTELLRARAREPAEAREYLFGDDWESDPLIYSLYADVVSGQVAPAELAQILRTLRVDAPLVDEAGALAAEVPRSAAVERIFINLERRSPPASFRSYGPRLVPTFNYFQTGVCLLEAGLLDAPAVAEIARALVSESDYTPSRLANSLADIQRRGHVDPQAVRRLQEHLQTEEILPTPPRGWLGRWLQPPASALRRAAPDGGGRGERPARLDYLELLARRKTATVDSA